MIPNFKYEKELQSKGFRLICGMDEVGRGAWAGPLVIAAIILNSDKKIYNVRDSKQLSPKKREKIYPTILDNVLDYSFGEASHFEIDKFGLSYGVKLAAKRCLCSLKIIPEIVLLDGNWNFLSNETKVKTITKGDTKSISIAAASIIAKVARDRLLTTYHLKFPHYNFIKNKGYGTMEHRKAIKKHGLSKIHRKSYKI